MRTLLVTGAAGFIGSHLAERLTGSGYTVRGRDCYTDFYARWLKQANAASIMQAGVSILPLDLLLDELNARLHTSHITPKKDWLGRSNGIALRSSVKALTEGFALMIQFAGCVLMRSLLYSSAVKGISMLQAPIRFPRRTRTNPALRSG